MDIPISTSSTLLKNVNNSNPMNTIKKDYQIVPIDYQTAVVRTTKNKYKNFSTKFNLLFFFSDIKNTNFRQSKYSIQ